ncbi:uncharacterized protein LOC131302910 [Rhododendron vialii]|uniref:uncharacterized protein LOC131302910 n=1 Tax=Rhododendron vialii TaxID=182163 RepID=UPI00265F5E10|nr:uncharacterized protein LOC131302910 [Rhododendron vialii]
MVVVVAAAAWWRSGGGGGGRGGSGVVVVAKNSIVLIPSKGASIPHSPLDQTLARDVVACFNERYRFIKRYDMTWGLPTGPKENKVPLVFHSIDSRLDPSQWCIVEIVVGSVHLKDLDVEYMVCMLDLTSFESRPKSGCFIFFEAIDFVMLIDQVIIEKFDWYAFRKLLDLDAICVLDYCYRLIRCVAIPDQLQSCFGIHAIVGHVVISIVAEILGFVGSFSHSSLFFHGYGGFEFLFVMPVYFLAAAAVMLLLTVRLYSTAYAAVLLFCVRFSWIGGEFSRVGLKFNFCSDESGVRNKRGITRLSDVWNLPPTQRIIVKFNLAFVPVGNKGGVLTRFIGTVARKPHLCPINCNWHEVPLHCKEACWNIIQSKFAIPKNDSAREAIKKKTLKLLGTRLRDWRCTLKDLVRYWFSEEGKNLSLKNKRGGDKSASVHTARSNSYARHAHELEVDSGFAPSQAKLYIPTHTKEDGKPVNDIAGENIEAIKVLMESQPNGWEGNSKGSIFWSRDDIYSQVIHTKKWHGCVPGCGFGPTPKSSGSTCLDCPRFNVADEEERMRDKETIRKLKDKVHAQAVEMSTLKEQVAEMSTLKEQVAEMMRHMPEFTGLQVRDGCNGPFDQASPHAQRSSHASHDIECSNGGNRTV